jgi:hypothetical protein
MLKNLDFLWCCGNSQAAKLNQYNVTLNPIEGTASHIKQTNQLALNESSIPIMIASPLELPQNDDFVKNNILGKSENDVDIIGLCKMINEKTEIKMKNK